MVRATTTICLAFTIPSLALAGSARAASAFSVSEAFPAGAQLDGSQDLAPYIQKALDENPVVVVPGSGDPDKPFVYGVRCDASRNKSALEVPAGHALRMEPGAQFLRLPSSGSVIRAGRNARLRGVVIDGNKAAHWPEFQDLGKGDFGVLMLGRCLVADCTVFDNPGIAFGTYADDNTVRRCVARNVGYIDLKFNADYYQGKWDRWSGDGFYMRGHGNVVVDCDAIDCFRWGYTTCHEKAGGATYIDCRGSAPTWRTYGFIDIEGCDGDGSTMIRCTAKDPCMHIAISTSGSTLIDCEAAAIHVYNSDDVLIEGCTTYGGGLAVGGWSSSQNSAIRGGNNPVVIGNTINKYGPSSGVESTSDWSFSVVSSDGRGIVANNVLNEYEGPVGKGTGMKLENVADVNNAVTYGSEHVPPARTRNASPAGNDVKAALRQARMRAFAADVPALAARLGITARITGVTVAPADALFIKDLDQAGEPSKWFDPERRPATDRLLPIRIGEHWDDQYGTYHGHAWYFIVLPLDMDHKYMCDAVHLLFGGVDSQCRVFLNGTFVGEHEGWKDPFVMKVPFELLRWDENEPNDLAVHVWTPAGLGGVYGHVAAVMTQGPDGAVESGRTVPVAVPVRVAENAPVQGDAAGQQSRYDFLEQPESLGLFDRTKRVSLFKPEARPDAPLQLRGGGAVITKESGFGAGVYSAQFLVDESHPKFQYHVPCLVFGARPKQDTATANALAGSRLELIWRGTGHVELKRYADAGEGDEAAKPEKLGAYQEPGPGGAAKYPAGTLVRLTAVVRDGAVDVYLNRDATNSKPDCTFELPDSVLPGAFGFHNPKWFSYVYVRSLEYSPLPEIAGERGKR